MALGFQVAHGCDGTLLESCTWNFVTDVTLLGEVHVALSYGWHSAWRVARDTELVAHLTTGVALL